MNTKEYELKDGSKLQFRLPAQQDKYNVDDFNNNTTNTITALNDEISRLREHNTDTAAHTDIREKIGNDISAHNTSETAHGDIRDKIGNDISAHNTSGEAHQNIQTSIINQAKIYADEKVADKVPFYQIEPDVVSGETISGTAFYRGAADGNIKTYAYSFSAEGLDDREYCIIAGKDEISDEVVVLVPQSFTSNHLKLAYVTISNGGFTDFRLVGDGYLKTYANSTASKAKLYAKDYTDSKLDDHNNDENAHMDIRNDITGKVTLAVSNHNDDEAAHGNLFNPINAHIDDLDNRVSIAGANLTSHNTSETAHADIRTELTDIRTGADGTVYDSAGISVRAQLSKKVDINGKDQITKYNSIFYTKTANIRDKSRQIYGKQLSPSTGNVIGGSTMLISEFFEVGENTQIGLTDFDNKGKIYVRFFFYDEIKAFISQIEVNSSSGVANIPETAAYVRYQTYISYDDRKFTITMPYTTEDIEPYVFEEMPSINEQFADLKNGNFKDGTIEPRKTVFFDTIVNLIDQSKVVTGAILSDTGVLATSFTNWTATDFIPVEAGKTYYYSDNGVAMTKFTGALYDVNKKYLNSIGDTCPFTAEVDGYCRISNSSWTETRQLQSDKLTEFVPYDEPKSTIKEKYLPDNIGKNQNYLDKKVLILGDSITHLDTSTSGWVKYFMQIVQPAVKVNLAVDGATWKDKVDNQVYDGNPQPSTTGNCIGNQVQKVINEKANGNIDYDDFDVIIIAAGTNDAFNINPDSETIDDVESQFISAYGTQGTFSIIPLDSVNRRTFSGIMRYTYQKLIELYPNAKFCICSPLQEVYENYVSTYKKGELFRYIASRLSVHYFNTRDCGICNLYESPKESIDYDNPTNEESTVKRDLADGIHTNASGAEKLGKFIAKEFIKLFEPVETI